MKVLQPWRHLDLADVNWRRLAAVRRAIVYAAQGEEEWSPETVRVAHRADERALAWLLAGWLASCLGWPPDHAPRIDAFADGDRLLLVELGREPNVVRLDCDGHRVIVHQPGKPPSMIGVPSEGEADAVAAELHTLSRDVRLHDALSALDRYFSAS